MPRRAFRPARGVQLSRPPAPARRVGGCLLDIDGTVYQDGKALGGAVEALGRLRHAGIPFRFVTNTTRKPRSAVVAALASVGIDTTPGECFTAPVAAASWLRARDAGTISLLLEPATHGEFSDFRIDDDEPDYVVVGDLGSSWRPETLDRAFRALMSGAELVAIQRNRYWRRQGRLRLDAGAWVAALEYASGKTAHLVGKPSAGFFEAAASDLGLTPERVAMVGDDFEADILGARSAGMIGIAVRTGKFLREREAEVGRASDAILDSVADLPGWLGLPE